jgi:hypothetical protein
MELNTLVSGHNLTQINENFRKIADAFNEQVLYRDNPDGVDNALQVNLDLNGKKLYNLPAPTADSHPARFKDVKNAIAGLAGQTANFITFSPTNEISSDNVQGAIEEVLEIVESDLAATKVYVSPYTGGVSRTITSKLQERISPKDFGAVPDWNGTTGTNNTVKMQAAINAAIANKLPLFIDGNYYVGGNLTANGSLTLVGNGAGLSNIVFGTNVNLVYSGGTQAEYQGNELSLYGVGFRTTNQNTKPVVDIVWVGGAGGTSSTVVIEDCEVSGTGPLYGFRSAFRFDNARNISVRNVRILGDRSSATVNSSYGFEVVGDASPVELQFSQCRVYFVKNALYVTGTTEGVYLSQCAFVAVRTGVNWTTTLSKPLLSIVNSHINATEACVNTVNVVQQIINGNLLYIQNFSNLAATLSANIQMKIDVPGTDLAAIITNNVLYYLSGAANKNGIVVLAGSGTESSVIDQNIIVSMDSGIVLSTDTSSVHVGLNNKFLNCSNAVTNNGVGNKVIPKVPYQGSVVVPMAVNGTYSDHVINIPVGLFVDKPECVLIGQGDNLEQPMIAIYKFSDPQTTASAITIRLRRIDNAEFTGGSVRLSYSVS